MTKGLAHLAATLSSWAVATIVSAQARRLCTPSSWNMDVLGLLLVLIQIAAMGMPYVGYHKAGGPVLFPPISCANNYTLHRRVLTWVAFTLLAGGMHAWTSLTSTSNPMQITAVATTTFHHVPSAGLILLAGNPVPLRDYTTAVVARGTHVEWLTPAAFSHAPSKATARHKAVIRLSMAGHLLGALVLIVVPPVGGLLRREWYTKVCSCFALALLTGRHRRLPIYQMANSLLTQRSWRRTRERASRWAGRTSSTRLDASATCRGSLMNLVCWSTCCSMQ